MRSGGNIICVFGVGGTWVEASAVVVVGLAGFCVMLVINEGFRNVI